MITVKNLKRVGFKPSEWIPIEDGGRYRMWTTPPVQDGVFIEVVEEDIPGTPTMFIPSITTEMGESIFLKLENVTQLLQLKELLSS